MACKSRSTEFRTQRHEGRTIKVYACPKHGECTHETKLPGIFCGGSKRRWARPCKNRAWPPTGLSFVRTKFIGEGTHRGGWPAVMQSLAGLEHSDGILLDDFVEQEFCYSSKPYQYREPWVGIFHHPPGYPAFSDDRERPETYLARPEFVASAKHLRLAVTLSEHSATWLRERLDCPVVALCHPTDLTAPAWRPEAALRERRLLQVGWYLRNTQAIYQARTPAGWTKARIWPARDVLAWVYDWDARVAKHWRRKRKSTGSVTRLPTQTNAEYDARLTDSVVLTELFAASANNVVIECLARATPLVVNRHPAVIEYLGEDYPLYFDDIRETASLLTEQRLLAAHEYLLARDKSRLEFARFAADLWAAVGGLR